MSAMEISVTSQQ